MEPFISPSLVVGSYEIPIVSVGISFCSSILSVTVGTVAVLVTVPTRLVQKVEIGPESDS